MKFIDIKSDLNGSRSLIRVSDIQRVKELEVIKGIPCCEIFLEMGSSYGAYHTYEQIMAALRVVLDYGDFGIGMSGRISTPVYIATVKDE